MLTCPRCSSANRVKSGKLNDRQRYKCKACHDLSTVAHKSDTATLEQRRLTVTLYLEGLGFLGSWGLIIWLSSRGSKPWANIVVQLKRSTAQIVEMDEMPSYVGQKNHRWSWMAVDRLGKRFLHAGTGTRGVVTGQRLWSTLRASSNIY